MFTTVIQADELKTLEHPLVLDCRFNLADPAAGEQAYAAGHLPGAHYLHLERDLSGPVTPESGRHPLPEPEKLAEKLQRLGLHPHQQVVVYDDCGGAMAARAWWLLRWLGHAEVAVLDGGVAAWQQAGGELIQAESPLEASEFVMQLQAEMAVAAEQLGDFTLVDARAAERYRGEVEPIDPVAGHIPGALNRPLTDNLSDGRFKPAEQLREEWQAVLSNASPDQVVHYCGSSVTACHNLLAMEIAGLNGARVYPGSWSEWIRDSKRPVATGEQN